MTGWVAERAGSCLGLRPPAQEFPWDWNGGRPCAGRGGEARVLLGPVCSGLSSLGRCLELPEWLRQEEQEGTVVKGSSDPRGPSACCTSSGGGAAPGGIRASSWVVEAPVDPPRTSREHQLWGGVRSGRCWLSSRGRGPRFWVCSHIGVQPHLPECWHGPESLFGHRSLSTRSSLGREAPPAGPAALLLPGRVAKWEAPTEAAHTPGGQRLGRRFGPEEPGRLPGGSGR